MSLAGLYVLAVLCAGVISCQNEAPSLSPSRGLQLSQQYCGSCHIYTPYDLLDKTAWMNVLPNMRTEIENAGITMNSNDWSEIYAHYVNNAPFNLPQAYQDSSTINYIESLSDTSIQAYRMNPSISVLECIRPLQSVIVGTQNGELYRIDSNKIRLIGNTNPSPIDIIHRSADSALLVLSMGEMGPKNTALGKLQIIKDSFVETLVDELNRPVHLTSSDLDGDQTDEYIISCFGSTRDSVHTGGVFIFQQQDGSYMQRELAPYTGAIKTITYDYNGDGKMDILALFSQGDERIILFENQGDLKFREKTLLRFHPLYGSLDFLLEDINDDELMDIILANGDNADYSQIFKPYHGLRLFKNKGNFEFSEELFVSINGAAKLEIEDFDKDGIRDIMVLSTYPDLYTRPWESVRIFYNRGEFQFNSKSLEKEANGNWLLCTLCNFNAEEGIDLFLGINNSVHRNFPPQRRAVWQKNKSALFKYRLN